MGTCCSNNEWLPGVCVTERRKGRDTVHREQQRECVASEELTFICGAMSHFQASQWQFFVCARGFLAHVSLKCKWTFLVFAQ